MWFKSNEHFYSLTKTDWTDVQQGSSINQGCFACQLDNVIMQTNEGLDEGLGPIFTFH